ncbi:MPN domain-containing protein [Actinomadura macrotermitis]|uniref:JAB domain-containing protein n=1 Tax=Actinomadura macrotermitis TaxID=2585200 RepID=A0A7K0BPW3_9ACTN|nr:hypothetical protein [Actinomadura macrotermitis]MQY03211.1 hypothetical protein [Actinomadura macrotermitis]
MTETITGRSLNCRTAVVAHHVLRPFLTAAMRTYELCTPSTPLSCFAVLVGEAIEDVALIRQIAPGRSVRATDPAAAAEFRSGIVPRFGMAYENEHRGFWADPQDLLRIHREAEEQGWDILGSIHMHPDWHRIGPPHERGLRLSQAPTPMDVYMFGSTGWPINMICYIERSGCGFQYAIGAWAPPPAIDATCCPAIDVRFWAEP